MNAIHSVSLMKIRYFDYHSRYVNHHADCEIYSLKKRCDCGLLHDLRILDNELAMIIYEGYEIDLYQHDTGNDKSVYTKEEENKYEMLVKEIFGGFEPLTLTDIKKTYDLYKKIIDEGFGKDGYPAASIRLNKWFEEMMNKREIAL